ncbi:MAG: penicillin-binding transpeptidase domain-containing protein [Candidatus Flexifilum sp.]
MGDNRLDLTVSIRIVPVFNPLRSRSRLWIRLLPAALAFVLLTGCEAIGLGGSAPVNPAAPAAPLTPQTPRDVVAAFLEAWNSRSYEAMYALLSPESQSLTSFPVFRTTYETADAALATQGVRYTLGAVREQGMTAEVRYDAAIASGTFGTIDDAGRVMRLIRGVGGQWRVAWSTMDIFDGYAPGTRLVAQTARPPRGHILDRDGDYLVEQGGTVVELYVMRSEIPNEADCVTYLSGLIRWQRGDLQAFFNRFDVNTIFGFADMSAEDFARYGDQLAEICAIRTDTRVTRRYVGHGAAAHITGYIGQMTAEEQTRLVGQGYSPGDLIGKTGIEAQYEAELAGEATRVLQIVDSSGLIIRQIAESAGRAPQDVTLTIDDRLQLAAAQALADAYNYAENNWANRAHSTGGGLVVLDVDTGAVLALASYPTFDPGIFNPDTGVWLVGDYILQLGRDPRQPFLNRVTQQQYPPGSTYKIITTAAAAAEGVFNPNETFYCGREWRGQAFGDTRAVRYDWRNFEPPEFNFDTGEVTIAEALAASCNPFYYQMGAELYTDRGPNVLVEYARRMGLGRSTGIDLIPADVSGQILPPQGVDAAISSAIGQFEIQVSILQMARMAAGIANGGTLYRPYVVQRVGAAGEAPTYEARPTIVGEMGLSETVLDIVREGMCMVTDSTVYGRTSGQRLGTAWFVFSDPEWYPAPYTVCGKTGTAQTGRIEPMGWFVAYAPADDPQIAVAGMIEYGREGSETIAPIIRRVLDAYFNVPPDQVMPYPRWWEGEYVPLTIPEGSTGV